MHKARLEAFSDGVLAIIITIMVLDFKVPEGAGLAALRPLLPVFICYVLSFIYIGIYWNNHHHLMHAVERIHGPTLWANLHLLFWLSLVPFVTGWISKHPSSPWPVAIYGGVLLFSGIAYFLLTRSLLSIHNKGSSLATALGSDFKGKISIAVYAVAIVLAFQSTDMAYALYGLVALMWIIPDRRIEGRLSR